MWWKKHQTNFPIFACMAFNIFSIPAISSKIKCMFSAAKRLITDEQNCLKAEVIKASKCQKHWLNVTDLIHGLVDLLSLETQVV